MKILVHHRIASRDGQSVHLEEMVAALRALGHEVVLVGPAGFAHTTFGGSNRLVDRLKAIVPAPAYEVLELAYNVPAFVRLALAVRRLRPDVVYERYSLFLLAGLWMRRLGGIPCLLEVNSPLYEERAAHDGLALGVVGRCAQRALWRGADHVLPVTRVLARMVEAHGVPSSRITVVPNGIDPSRFGSAPAADTRVARSRTVLGFTGFVREWNGVAALLDLAARTRDTLDLHIAIVGDGPARPVLEKTAACLGISDRLAITGTVGRDDVARHVARFDIAILPAVTPYSSPLKLFEYLALGCAIVAPDGENIREILTHDHDALLFDPASADTMQAAIVALARDPARRARLGANARATIVRRALTWSSNAQRVVEIAAGLTGKRSTR